MQKFIKHNQFGADADKNSGIVIQTTISLSLPLTRFILVVVSAKIKIVI